MNDFVAMGQHLCEVCGRTFDSGEILIDKRMRPIRNAVTDWGLCPDDKKLFDDGYLALVGVHAPSYGTTIKRDEADRTGRLAHLRRSVAKELFNVPLDDKLALVFVEDAVIDMIVAMQKESENETHSDA